MVVIDATVLVLLLQPKAAGPPDVPDARERLDYLVSQLERTGTKICIPAPALSEALVRVGPKEAIRVVEAIRRQSVFEVKPFDQLAAIELADIVRKEMGKKRPKRGAETKAKLKFDRQIIAIARVAGADTVYSDDQGVQRLGKRLDIVVKGVADLPRDPDDDQGELFDELDELPDADD